MTAFAGGPTARLPVVAIGTGRHAKDLITGRRAGALSVILALTASLTGCALTIQPVISESMETFDPRLVGVWQDTADSDRARVARGSGNRYLIEYTDAGRVGKFEGRLGRLGDRLVLEVRPAPADDAAALPSDSLLIRAHLQLVVDVSADEVRVAAIDAEALRLAIESGTVRLAYGAAEDRLVVHGPSNELGAALARFIAQPGALEDPDVWRRVVESTPPGAR